MFRPRDPQSSLFATSMLLPEEKRRRLEESWAWAFRTSALPLIEEEPFRDLYSPDNGRPNKPVQTVIGVLLLKEMFDLTDEGALGELEYDLRWHVALDLEPEEAHCCQKTLHNFRAKLVESGKAKALFEGMTGRLIEALGVRTDRQRLDSTHIVPNIAVLTRLGLFCETARVFLKDLRRFSEERFAAVPASLRGRYLKEDLTDSRYGDARSSEARRRLGVCARDVWRLVERFRGDEEVKELEGYGLLERLLAEQCEVSGGAPGASEGDADAGEPPAPAAAKEAKKVRSDSLQTPHDPGVTYSGRKGKGYEVQVAETCGNGEKPEVITRVEVTRSCDSDAAAAVPAVEDLAEREMQPKELIADTGYGSTGNAVECARMGTELVSPVPGPKVEGGCSGHEHAEVLSARREYERTEEFRKRYAVRAGIEGTNSELKRAHGLGRLRIRGGLRVRAAVYLKALACNVKRMVRHVAERGRKAEAAAATAEAASSALCAAIAASLVRVAGFAAFWRRLPARAAQPSGALAA